MRPTLQQKLHKTNSFYYWILSRLVGKLFFAHKLHITYNKKVNPRDFDAPFIAVGNHVSRLDGIYAALAFLPHTMNFVAAYNEFFRSHLAFLMRLMHVIPKKNFAVDVYAIKQIYRVIQNKGNIMIFTEGMSSISGANQPSAIATGKLLKQLGLPVLRIGISGGYFTSPRFCSSLRPGRVNVDVDLLFTPEQLTELSAIEVQDKLDFVLYHDEYDWNRIARIKFRSKGKLANNLHEMLYWCPKCCSEFTMIGMDNRILCRHCGNGGYLNEYYDLFPIDNNCSIPDNPRIWWDMQRQYIREWVQDDAFVLREQVKLGVLPKYKYLSKYKTSEIVGEGELLLYRGGLKYNGTRHGMPFSVFIDSINLPTFGICDEMSKFFVYSQGEFLEFYPTKDSAAKWLLTSQENHRVVGGLWKDFGFKDRVQ